MTTAHGQKIIDTYGRCATLKLPSSTCVQSDTSNGRRCAPANVAVQAPCMRFLLPSAVQQQWSLRGCDVLRTKWAKRLLVCSGGMR
jgi:hypothetical protein